jgi:hypothetical protein
MLPRDNACRAHKGAVGESALAVGDRADYSRNLREMYGIQNSPEIPTVKLSQKSSVDICIAV